jgi:two-component system, NarL family, captular synthesis response regulator RcsB
MEGPAKVAILDDHPLIRSALSHYFASQPTTCVVAEAGDVAELMNQVSPGQIDIAILDYLLAPGALAGQALIDRVLRHYQCKVVVFTADADPATHQLCLLAGASAVVNKSSSLDVLLATVNTIR